MLFFSIVISDTGNGPSRSVVVDAITPALLPLQPYHTARQPYYCSNKMADISFFALLGILMALSMGCFSPAEAKSR